MEPIRSRRRISPYTATLTLLAVIGFASNSLLCRMALGSRAIDAASFTTIRLGAGALALFGLVRVLPVTGGTAGTHGSFTAALALFGYAAAFSFAYLRLGAANGALILFGTVQAALIGWGLRRGERPTFREWAGLLLALGGLLTLTLPGVTAPDPLGAALMAVAGLSWAIYTCLGRGEARPLLATAGNFARALPFALLLSLPSLVSPSGNSSARGFALAAFSGAVTSGIAYSLWYAALPGLGAAHAALVQIAVVPLAALGGVVLLHEPLTARLLLAGITILGGIGLAMSGRIVPR